MLALRLLTVPYAVSLGTTVLCGVAWITFIVVVKRLGDLAGGRALAACFFRSWSWGCAYMDGTERSTCVIILASALQSYPNHNVKQCDLS